MCLITDDPEYKKDKEPIIVYKIIVKTLKECPVRYRTPFTWHIVTFPIFKTAHKIRRRKSIIEFGEILYNIEEGVIHCYSDLRKARKVFKVLKSEEYSKDSRKYELWKCAIPPRTPYIKGCDGTMAAKSIEFIKRIKG